jgi:glutathione S-transferase
MGLKIYGIPGSRALRSLWAIEETGVPYEHVPTHFVKDSKTPEYMAVNPNGRIPALIDGDLTLFESMAINLYLAKTYAPALYPDDPGSEAKALQWSIWAISEIEPLQMQIVVQKLFTPEEQRDAALIDTVTKNLDRPLKVLDDVLAQSDTLLGGDFSIADLNVSGVMLLLNMVNVELGAHEHVSRWIKQCHSRPALARAQAL